MSSSKSPHELGIDCVKNPLDPDEFRRQGHLIIDFLADYLKNIEELPVIGHVEPGYLARILPKSAPHVPEPIEAILEDIHKHIVPGLTHWQSPNFFAYYPINASTAGIIGDILCSGFNVVPFTWLSSPASTELENIVMDWLGELLGLPKSFLFSGGGGGVIHGGTGESILCTLAAAKDRALTKIGQENINKLVVYCSDQTNCTIRKSARLAGICDQNIKEIKTSKMAQFGMCPNSLRQVMEADIKVGLVPVYLCATLGTTSTSAVDPIKELCRVAEEYDVWVHIDAAFAGAACICPEYSYLIDGVELANSFSFNAHKWLLAGLDCCCLWVRDPAALIQALSTEAVYLRDKPSEPKKVVDYKDWQICLSRRFRALRLWIIMRSNGVVNLRKHIRGHMKLAELFEELVEEDERFEVACQRNFSLVCFRVSPKAFFRPQLMSSDNASRDNHACTGNGIYTNRWHTVKEDEVDSAAVNEVNAKLLERINGTGKVFMTHSMVGEAYTIRFAVGATLVEERHVRTAWKLVQEHANAILSG